MVNNFLIFSLKMMFVQLIFLLLYEFLFKKETFFRWNRLYLLSALGLSLFLPLFPVTITSSKTLSIITLKEVILSSGQMMENSKVTTDFSISQLLLVIYITITILFTLLFLRKIIRLNHLLNRSRRVILNGTRIYLLKDSTQAFTFLNKICIGERCEDASHILTHEKVHKQRWHTLDLLLVEVLKTVFWFNPLLYRYRRLLIEVHEFEADQIGFFTYRHQYFKLLMNQAFGIGYCEFTNALSIPTLTKKRIQMLRKEKSSKNSLFKYVLAIPLVVLSMVMVSAENIVPNMVTMGNNTILPQPTEVAKDSIRLTYAKVDQKPRFKDCENVAEDAQFDCFKKQLDAHLIKNFQYPEVAKNQKIEGRVYVKFVIGEKGDVSISGVRGPDKLLEDEAVRIIKLLPQFIPAKENGKVVPVEFAYPITFKLLM